MLNWIWSPGPLVNTLLNNLMARSLLIKDIIWPWVLEPDNVLSLGQIELVDI